MSTFNTVRASVRLLVAFSSATFLVACAGGGGESTEADAAAASSTLGATSGSTSATSGPSSDGSPSASTPSNTPTATSPGSLAATAAGEWIQCANEGTVCKFAGTRDVRYGTTSTAVTKVFTSEALCDNSVFGDPVVGTAKSCWHAAQTTNAPPPAAATMTTAMTPAPAATLAPASTTSLASNSTSSSASSSQSVPTPESIKGKRVVGRIDATSGQVIENVHVVNHTGPCIVINGQSNVVIRDSEIGPCGDQTTDLEHSGIRILSGSTNIIIERNVIHDAPALVSATAIAHPITIHKNLFYNVRGTEWAVQAIGVGESRSGTGSTRITCNIIDDTLVEQYPMAGGRERKVEDHINFYNSGGSSEYPVEIAYNRIRGHADGKGGESGTGMQLGDSPAGGGGAGSNVSGYFYVHDNIVKHTNGQGIALGGGVGSVVRNNKVDNRGSSLLSATGWPFGLRNWDPSKPASVTYSGNKAAGHLWAFNRDGQAAPALSTAYASSGFQVTDSGDNDWQYAFTSDIWNDPTHSACTN